jgi:hypothetical protein
VVRCNSTRLTIDIEGRANEGRERVEQLTSSVRSVDLIISFDSTDHLIRLTTKTQGYCSPLSKSEIKVLSFKGSFSFPVPAFCCLMAELAGTIKVGILLGIEATEGNSALWVVGVPVPTSLLAGAVVDSAEGDSELEDRVRLLATINSEAEGVYGIYDDVDSVEVDSAADSDHVVTWDPVDGGVDVTDPTDRSSVETPRGSVVKPEIELEAEAVMSEASAETVSLALAVTLALAVAVAVAADDASWVTEALAYWLEGWTETSEEACTYVGSAVAWVEVTSGVSIMEVALACSLAETKVGRAEASEVEMTWL